MKVKLLKSTADINTLAAILSCRSSKSSYEILTELKKLSKKDLEKREKSVFQKSLGRAHGAVGDKSFFDFSISEIPRLATLFLCLPEYLDHLQQSLRVVEVSEGNFYTPARLSKNSEFNELLRDSSNFYHKMVNSGVPREDARYILPLFTLTNISTHGNVREFSHLLLMSQDEFVPEVIKDLIKEIFRQLKSQLFEDMGYNFQRMSFFPSARLFYSDKGFVLNDFISRTNKPLLLGSSNASFLTRDLLKKAILEENEGAISILKHVHFEFSVPMSLASFHQAIRQRTWNHSVQSIFSAADSRNVKIMIPPKVEEMGFQLEFEKNFFKLMSFYWKAKKEIPKKEIIGIVPHALMISDFVHINAWNAIHGIGIRTCPKAQWEIRKKAWEMVAIINSICPALGNWLGPRCLSYGDCPEGKECIFFKAMLKKRESLL